jgi:hypothetical protein
MSDLVFNDDATVMTFQGNTYDAKVESVCTGCAFLKDNMNCEMFMSRPMCAPVVRADGTGIIWVKREESATPTPTLLSMLKREDIALVRMQECGDVSGWSIVGVYGTKVLRMTTTAGYVYAPLDAQLDAQCKASVYTTFDHKVEREFFFLQRVMP